MKIKLIFSILILFFINNQCNALDLNSSVPNLHENINLLESTQQLSKTKTSFASESDHLQQEIYIYTSKTDNQDKNDSNKEQYMTLYFDLIKNLIWPSLLLIIVLIFKEDIKIFINRIEKFRIKDIEAELSVIEKNLKNISTDLDTEISEFDKLMNEEELWLINLSDTSPKIAILETWNILEQANNDFLIKQAIDPTNVQKSKMLREVMYEKYQDFNIYNEYRRLMSIRNNVSHAQSNEIDQLVAKQYIQSSLKIVKLLKSLSK